MPYQIFKLPKETLIAGAAIKPSWKVNFYVTGTTTPTPVYTTSALSTTHTQPVQADSGGTLAAIYLDPTIVYKASVYDQNDVLQYTIDPVNDSVLSAAIIGAILYPRTAAEISAGVTPTNYAYPPGDVRRYGAVGDDSTDCTAAIQAAISVGGDVYFVGGTYRANNLTQTASLQKLMGFGWVRIKKNADGPILTCSGSDVELNGIGFSGDASSPTFTGDGVVMNGDNPRLINCGVRWISGLPVKATGNHVQIIGTCDTYQTTDATSGGYDIQIGVSGTATLYHRIKGIKSSQPTGGIKFIDCGGQVVEGSQFGKLAITSGTSPAGVNGGHYYGNRILGNVDVNISNSSFSANLFGAITVTLAGSTSGHRFGPSNGFDSSATLADSSVESTFIDSRDATTKTYTPTWTAASVNPAIGNGSIDGRYYKLGKLCFVSIKVVMGSTTTFGTGAWFFSLPAIPATFSPQLGSCRVLDSGTNFRTGVAVTLSDGTARMQGTIDSDTSTLDSARPMTWASGDELYLTVTFVTD